MTNREQSQTAMAITLDQELTTDAAAYDNDPDFKAQVVDFRAKLAENKQAGLAAHVDNTGFSQEKLNQKIVLSEEASNISGKAFVRFTKLGKLSLADQLHIEPSDYMHVADAESARIAQAGHDFLATNIADLGPTLITIAMLVDYQKEIDKFTELKGSSEAVHEVSAELTKKFKASFKPMIDEVDHLKLMVRDYKKSNNGFYTRLMASAAIPTVNIHHTYVAVTVTGRDSGRPLENFVCALTNGKKSAKTDWEGNATIEETKAGADVLTVSIVDDNGNTKVVYSEHIKIKRGTTNSFKVVIEGR
jgi:hypothetical protein